MKDAIGYDVAVGSVIRAGSRLTLSVICRAAVSPYLA
jgi:hypothetical protein